MDSDLLSYYAFGLTYLLTAFAIFTDLVNILFDYPWLKLRVSYGKMKFTVLKLFFWYLFQLLWAALQNKRIWILSSLTFQPVFAEETCCSDECRCLQPIIWACIEGLLCWMETGSEKSLTKPLKEATQNLHSFPPAVFLVFISDDFMCFWREFVNVVVDFTLDIVFLSEMIYKS